MKITIKRARLAFPVLFRAKAINDGEPQFNASFLLDATSDAAQIKAINTTLDAVAKEKWGAKADGIMKSIRAAEKLCLRDGDRKAEYAGFEGSMYVSASNKMRPTLKDRDGTTPLAEQDGKPYAGCYVNAVVEVWAQDNQFGKRINASLLGVQFVSDGDRFTGGGVATDADFEDLGVDEEADDLS